MTTIVLFIAVLMALVAVAVSKRLAQYYGECKLITVDDNIVRMNMDDYFNNVFMDHIN